MDGAGRQADLPKGSQGRDRADRGAAQCTGGSDASRQRIAVFCPIELNVKHGLTSI